MMAEAVPARAAWLERAPTAALGRIRPMQPMMTMIGGTIPNTPPRSSRAQIKTTRAEDEVGRGGQAQDAAGAEAAHQAGADLAAGDEHAGADAEQHAVLRRREVEALDQDLRGAADIGEHAEHGEAAEERIGEEEAVGQNFDVAVDEATEAEADAVVGGHGVGQLDGDEDGADGAVDGGGPEDGAPGAHGEHEAAESGGEDRGGAHDEDEAGHEAGGVMAVGEVADDGGGG